MLPVVHRVHLDRTRFDISILQFCPRIRGWPPGYYLAFDNYSMFPCTGISYVYLFIVYLFLCVLFYVYLFVGEFGSLFVGLNVCLLFISLVVVVSFHFGRVGDHPWSVTIHTRPRSQDRYRAQSKLAMLPLMRFYTDNDIYRYMYRCVFVFYPCE